LWAVTIALEDGGEKFYNYAEESIQNSEHGESLKSRIRIIKYPWQSGFEHSCCQEESSQL